MEKANIRDLTAFKIGNAQDLTAATGCTAIICEAGAVCGVDVRGGSPVTRDTDALDPKSNRKAVHAVVLAGGSSFGLDAAGGVMRCLEARGIGRDAGVAKIPNVCAAILFDLKCGRADVRPDAEMGFAAASAAFADAEFTGGNFGAGTGATVGTLRGAANAMKGGLGKSAYRRGELLVGAVAAVNCAGDVVSGGKIIAGALNDDKKTFADSERVFLSDYFNGKDLFSGNTVLVCIITNAKLEKAAAAKLAALGQNGIARAIRPAHTSFDGDTVFAMCSGEVGASADAVGILAAKAVEDAILDAVNSATSAYGYPSAREMTT